VACAQRGWACPQPSAGATAAVRPSLPSPAALQPSPQQCQTAAASAASKVIPKSGVNEPLHAAVCRRRPSVREETPRESVLHRVAVLQESQPNRTICLFHLKTSRWNLGGVPTLRAIEIFEAGYRFGNVCVG
jgi:hypothetical protein